MIRTSWSWCKLVASMYMEDVKALLNAAADFHGHLGPFLALGVRTSLAGLRELKAVPGDTKLRVTVMLKYAVPFSCMLDGVQAVTKCTVGNKRLAWKESEEMGVVFTLNEKANVEVIVNRATIQKLGRKLAQKPSELTVRRLALDVTTMPEKELFSVKRV